MWSGLMEPAKIYIQESDVPLILTMAQNGTYADAMSSTTEMNVLVEHLLNEADNAANMDW